MNNQTTSRSRRTLLKKASMSGGVALSAAALPNSWVQPVVESTILPTHAQTSLAFFGSGLSGTDTQTGNSKFIEGLVDVFVPKAHAAIQHAACAAVMGDTVAVQYQDSQNQVRYTGDLDAGGAPGSLTPLPGNCEACESLSASIVDISDVITLRIQLCFYKILIDIEIPQAPMCDLPELELCTPDD